MRNTLVPDRLIMKMSYKDNITLSNTINTFSIWNGRLNSIYDPDYAIVNGHQPLGFDQWSPFYNKFRVFKAFVQVTAINNTASAAQVGVLPYNPVSSTISSVDDSTYEQPHAVSKTLGGVQGMNKAVLKKMVDIPRILGRSHTQYKSMDSTSSLFTTNPQELCNLAIFTRSTDGVTAPATQIVLNITYYVELFDRKTQTISYPAGKDPEAGASPSYVPQNDH